MSDRENAAETGLRKDPVLAVETRGEARVVKLAGELDRYNAHQVGDALLDACSDSPQRIVVDPGEVEFIDSTALGVLIEEPIDAVAGNLRDVNRGRTDAGVHEGLTLRVERVCRTLHNRGDAFRRRPKLRV